ncbi:hypothetical protein [Dokdonella soli]|uniref:Yip1 domain-containing protein n=1 Tax=Dokdonella soli TaxID=529810 RepID=A0ABN1IQ87_9GAMM
MNEFEYITVLLSILIGLGVTQLLSGIARLVRDGRALAQAWWVMVLVATLLLANLQVWWVSFGWRHVADWTFFSYVSFMILPVLLYLLAYLILPADLHLDGAGLARTFIAKRKPFYTLIALVPVASFVQQWMLAHAAPQADLDTGLRVLWLVLALPGFLSGRVAVQAALAVTYFVLLVAYISLLFARMG